MFKMPIAECRRPENQSNVPPAVKAFKLMLRAEHMVELKRFRDEQNSTRPSGADSPKDNK